MHILSLALSRMSYVYPGTGGMSMHSGSPPPPSAGPPGHVTNSAPPPSGPGPGGYYGRMPYGPQYPLPPTAQVIPLQVLL